MIFAYATKYGTVVWNENKHGVVITDAREEREFWISTHGAAVCQEIEQVVLILDPEKKRKFLRDLFQQETLDRAQGARSL